MGDGEWLKEAEERKTTGRRNGGRNIWKRKNSATIFSARDKQRSLNIFKDSKSISKITPFIGIWCVYDKDSFPSNDVNGVVQRAEVLNQKNPDIQYHAAWSNECIEFWFMLHFAYYTANNHRSEYKKFLNEKFQELGIGKYEKNMDNIFETLMNGGNPKLAIRYARRIIKNEEGKTPAEIAPGTKVYELVEELAKYLPEEIKNFFI